MPPVVGILVSVLVLLLALAFILPGREPDPPRQPPSLPPDSAPMERQAQAGATKARDPNLWSALVMWGEFRRAHLKVKLLAGLGVSAFLTVATAYGAIRAAMEHDWSGLTALGVSCVFLIWASHLCWRGLRLH
jgi:hypothetical protein